jgi:D-alanyl-D-alanine carboxypeptidase/D-alanyl-D-alanine-endopeptidase (penicillin-binding protein 4)
MRNRHQGSGIRGQGKRVTALIALFVATGTSASLAEKIDQVLASSRAFWGIEVLDLETGKPLYRWNAGRFFVPASNTKLFTTAMALTRLGPNFTFQTRVVADAAPDANGRIAGPLRLIGGGDPNLSARAIPYQRGPISGNPLAAIEDLADQLASRGVKRIDGDIIGDDTWYVWEPYAAGWGIEDPESDDGPPISALTINDNAFSVTIGPGAREGDIAGLTLSPPLEPFRIDNRVLTAAPGSARRVRYSRLPGSPDLRLWGAVSQPQTMVFALDDPARYAAEALRSALEDRGIAVAGQAVALHEYPNEVADLTERAPSTAPGGVELARRVSAPLFEDLRITDKVSQNLHAELALRAVARARRNIGSFEAGLEELKTFLAEVGVTPEEYNIRDGSGLARLNLVTPSAVIAQLRYMHDSPHAEQWMSLLPVGGEDGTLASRFVGTSAAGRVHAKTGSLSHVSALSGYIRRANGKWVVFSILVNNYNTPTADVRGAMDRICNLIVE